MNKANGADRRRPCVSMPDYRGSGYWPSFRAQTLSEHYIPSRGSLPPHFVARPTRLWGGLSVSFSGGQPAPCATKRKNRPRRPTADRLSRG